MPKTDHEFDVEWRGPEGWERVHTEPTRRAALAAARTYRENAPGLYRVRRVRQTPNA